MNKPSQDKQKPRSGLCWVTKRDLDEMEKHIMSAITDWAETEEADLTAISTTLDGIVAGVAALDALIVSLKGAGLSPTDAAKLAEVKSASAVLVIKSGAISTTPPP